nr:MAG TPA: hypothetical protein [Bacteriophage sp.]DAN64217.1 MAG TPA: hypothetical protein [Bacteriophage sp.]DAU46335.1 MAG TPA: hypothetical protein [Bacteriophage sp.]
MFWVGQKPYTLLYIIHLLSTEIVTRKIIKIHFYDLLY